VSDTIRWQIISNVYSFMSRIRRSLAYRTEIGKNPYLLRRAAQEVPCLAVFPGREEVTREYKDNVHTMSVRVEGIVAVGDDDPVEVSELILADIIEGMTGQRWVLGYTSGGQNKPQVGDLVEGQTSGSVGIMESYTTATGAWADGDAEGALILRRKIGEYVAEDLDIGDEINLATTGGSISNYNAEVLVTGDLADDIVYLEGGIEEFPDSDQLVIGSSAMFNIVYRTVSGNPYYQPS
jgi:hypothetical protein